MNRAKIQLSADELALVQNAAWLLTKNNIIEKVFELFGEVAIGAGDQLKEAADWLPREAFVTSPKISKGEKYLGLPYVMLDYPRLFTREDVFAIRTLFWWGNFFSITLHIKGKYKNQYLPVLCKNVEQLKENDFYVGVGEDEWRHEYTHDNYIPLKQSDPVLVENILARNNFCRLSARIPLQDWNAAADSLIALYRIIVNAVKE